MSLLLEAEKLRRGLEKAAKKRAEKIEKIEAEYSNKVNELQAQAGSEVCCLLESAENLSSEVTP